MKDSAEGRQYSARRFRPGVLATLFAAFFLPLLLALGNWQLERADEKRALFADFAADGEPVDIAGHPLGIEELRRYAPVTASGRYLDDRQFLLDNMVRDGQAGFRVLTPLALEGGGVVMVDRGWVERDFTSGVLPAVPVDDGQRTLAGRIDRLPRAGIELAGGAAEGWPRVVQFPTREELEAALGAALVPGLLRLDEDQPDGYDRDWRPAPFGPERHIGYAVQWYALAASLVVIYLAWAFRKAD
jgi:surfeit locus 1 family protein